MWEIFTFGASPYKVCHSTKLITFKRYVFMPKLAHLGKHVNEI